MAGQFAEVKKITSKAFQLKKEKKYDQAMVLLEEGLEKYPDNQFLKTSLAELLVRMQRLKEAEQLAEEVLSVKADNFRAIYVKGEIARSKWDYEEARDYYREAYKIKKERFIAVRLINTLNKLEEYQKAFSLCQEWLEKEPDDQDFLRLKAAIFKKLGEGDKALKLYENYLEENPDDSFAYKQFLDLKLKDKSLSEAIAELKQLLKIGRHRDNPQIYSLLAQKLKKNKQFEQAVKYFKKALEKKPADVFLLKQLGFCLVKLDRQKEALPYLEDAFRQQPSDFYTRSSLLAVYRELGKYQQGIAFFKEIIEENSGFENLWGMIKNLNKYRQEEAEDHDSKEN